MKSLFPRAHLLFLWSAISLLPAMNPAPAFAGSESERLAIAEAYESGQIGREAYVVQKLGTFFSEETGTTRRLATGVTGKGSREVTLLLKEAALNLESYDADSREFVKALLKRPTDIDYDDLFERFYLHDPNTFEPDAGTYPGIGGRFKIWYTTSDMRTGGVSHEADPDFVASVADVLETVYQTEITDLGYPAPPDDGNLADNGGDEKFDVYLMNCGPYGIYGYSVADGMAGEAEGGDAANDYSTFIVIDNDFEEFETSDITAEEAMQITLAHEYHHAIQMGINVNASNWYMEATATWMEDQVFDDVDDNRQYLEDFFEYPETSLDDEASAYHLYGAWIWNEYLETGWDQAIVQSIWNRLDPAGSDNALDAVSDELVSRGDTLSSAYRDFVSVNYSKTGFYRDADDLSYQDVPASAVHTIDGDTIDDAWGIVAVDHLASNYINFIPGVSDDNNTLTIEVK